MTIPAMLCFDVEPDERRVTLPAASSWVGFEALVANLGQLREDLTVASGQPANFGWFLRLDPQIERAYGSPSWSIGRYAREFGRLADAGDEFGVHAHCWRWDDADGWWNDHGDVDWVAHCVETSLATYEAAFGAPAQAYRGGDRYLDPTVVGILERAGVQIDLTLEPGAPETSGLVPSERSAGTIPGVPPTLHAPFGPAGTDPFTVGPRARDRLLLTPLTAGVGFGASRAPDAPPIETLVLWTPPRAFRALFAHRMRDAAPTHLAFAVRSDAGRDGPSWKWVSENVRFVAAMLGDQVRWVTPSAALAVLRTDLAIEPSLVLPPVRAEDLTVTASALQAALRDAELSILQLAQQTERIEDERAAQHARAVAEIERVAEELRRTEHTVRGLEAAVAASAARGAALHQDLHDVSTELHRIQPYVALAEELRAERDALRATRWWRLHDRLHAPLAALARHRPVR